MSSAVRNKIKIIVTLGPATHTEEYLRKIKERGVDFARINMSHSSLDDLRYFIALAKKIGIPFIIDTEGSQVRTGELSSAAVSIDENAAVKIYARPIIGSSREICLRPAGVIEQLEKGDLIHIDFNALVLRVCDASTIAQGYITARSVTSGALGQNKAVVIDSGSRKKLNIAPLSAKDLKSIDLGLQAGIGYLAVSFVRSGEAVDYIKAITQGNMKIISKIECVDALHNLDEIILKSDYLLLDRGDLSKEIPIEKIPLAQKTIINRARNLGKEVFVATNLLETMVTKPRPNRAEVNDVVNTILDGAAGLTLSAETAIGQYPLESINMLNNLIKEAAVIDNFGEINQAREKVAQKLERMNYLSAASLVSSLIAPHGGKLVDGMAKEVPNATYLNSLEKIALNQNLQMDAEQIAIGAFSPLEGFMKRDDLQSVLDKMCLTSGIVWTVPVVLDVSPEQADRIKLGEEAALINEQGEIMATLLVEDKYQIDKTEFNQNMYGTNDLKHPGVRWVNSWQEVLLGGRINLIKRRSSPYKEYELTPRQVRKLFAERGWNKVVGFHTRNVIHRSHEFIQLKALEQAGSDGLFVHPVIGQKKPGDFHTPYIIKSYEKMIDSFYPKHRVVFATFATFSRYAGPREAIFTALCRKNFGCSHFIVGRDHTGVGDFYGPWAAHEIFEKFPDLEIKPIKFGKIFYSRKYQKHIHELDDTEHQAEEKLDISGTEARNMLKQKQTPPAWFMRPEISNIIIEAIERGEEVFVGDKEDKKDKQGAVIWFTGLSGSGKTTVALALKRQLASANKTVAIIDGDDVRANLHRHLGFSRDDIKQNNRLVAELAKEKAAVFDFVLVPIISPYQEDRAMVQEIVGNNFIEVFSNASLETCVARDTKGLYKQASAGEINNLIGVSAANPYEIPDDADLELKTDQKTVDQCVEQVIEYLNNHGWLVAE